MDDYDALIEMSKIIDSKISDKSVAEVEKVSPELIKEAIKRIKPNKSDPVLDITSDCLKNFPDPSFQPHCSVLIDIALLGQPH